MDIVININVYGEDVEIEQDEYVDEVDEEPEVEMDEKWDDNLKDGNEL